MTGKCTSTTSRRRSTISKRASRRMNKLRTRLSTQRNFRCHILPLLFFLSMFCACENIDFTKEEEGAESSDMPTSVPHRTGQGTLEEPYSVADVLQHADLLTGQKVWVIGYAVGSTYQQIGNATFSSPFSHDTNILLASMPECTDVHTCIPVELESTACKKGLSLMYNLQNHKQCVMLQGTVSAYFRVTGIRKVDKYKWFPGFTIPNANPEQWDIEDHPY